MLDHPERYRKRERDARWKVIGIVAAAFVAALVVGFLVAILISVQDQTAETAKVVTGHDTELAQIRAIARQVRAQESAATVDRQALAADVAKVSSYATALALQVTGDHAANTANSRAVCATLNAITADLGIHTACSVQS